MIRAYAKGSHVQISKHFNSDEFDCHCGNNEICKITLIDDLLVERLELIRVNTGRRIFIHSGCRCMERQIKLGDMGFKTSKGFMPHVKGMAVDFAIEGMTGLEMEDECKKAGFTSIGVAKTWVHADTRTEHRRWTY